MEYVKYAVLTCYTNKTVSHHMSCIDAREASCVSNVIISLNGKCPLNE